MADPAPPQPVRPPPVPMQPAPVQAGPALAGPVQAGPLPAGRGPENARANGAGQSGAGPDGAALLAPVFGWLPDEGAFVLPLGAGVRLAADALGDGKKKAVVPITFLPPLPGLSLETAEFDPRGVKRMLTISGKTAIPLTETRPFSIAFGRDGKPAEVDIRTKATLDWIGRPELRVSWTPEAGLAAQVTVEAGKFVPRSLAKVATATGDLALTLAGGRLSGALDTTIVARDVMTAQIKGAFAPEGLTASVNLTSNSRFLGEVTGQGAIDAAGVLTAKIEKQAAELPTPVKGLSFKGGIFSVSLNNDGTVSGGFTDLSLDYAGLASATASFRIEQGRYSGSADLNLTVPGLSAASGKIAMRDGKLSGAFALGKEAFPAGLPLKNGTIAGSITETGQLAFAGSVGVSLGPAGTGQLVASYQEAGGFSISAEVDLAVPGLQTAKFRVAYNGTDLAGEGELAVDPALLAGIAGRVKITYGEGRWAGETTLAYSADDGKLAGTITVRARQAEDDSIKVSGEGDVTAKIAPRLEGRLKATIKEEGGIDVSGSITVTEPVEMFPEARFDKELVNSTTKVPLWAILVAVFRLRAGVRAGIGPGVFRNITVTGSYSIGQEGEPAFSISGEMYIPAFVEGYVGFGAGLGVSVVLGSLTGGIEAMGTAGIYGAISVIPQLEYKDGDYAISGVASMAAGARLKLSLNAWAEVEALWITVWENTWELAAFTMPVGPDLGMKATMNYNFGKPEAPTLDFSTSDVDTDALIAGAMPKDGPPSAGVKDTVKNEAKWLGAQKAKGPAADAVPPALAQQAATVPPVAAPKPGTPPGGAAPGGAKPGDKAADAEPKTGAPPDPAKAAAQTKAAATPDPAAAGTVADDKAADNKTPRHPAQMTLAMLEEPPAPMPRTKAQQEADVEAAAKMVELVTKQVGNTDALDDSFAKIKKRFTLGVIEYVISPGPTVSVRVSVNSERMVTIYEEMKNLPSTDKDTKVDFTMADREFNVGPVVPGGKDVNIRDKVGVKMVADSLTPLHPQGSGPAASALGSIFNYLETQGPTGAHGYIKGHLLNDNLGGPGAAENLYPLTQQANADHSRLIEEKAKELVNIDHFWIRYEVEIDNEKVSDLPVPGKLAKAISIDADMHAKLYVLGTSGLPPRLVESVVIKSRFNTQPADLSDKKASELTPEELAKRDADREAFRAAPDINPAPGAAPGTNTSQSLFSVDPKTLDPSKLKQVRVDPALVQLSKAAGDGMKLVLGPELRAALRDLTVTPAADYLGRPDRALGKRIEEVAGLGDKTAGPVAAMAGIALAHDAAAPDTDISAHVGAALAPLRAVNNSAAAGQISRIAAQMRRQQAAFAAYLTRARPMDAAGWQALAAGFADASQADRVAVAERVAADLGAERKADNAAFKEVFRAAGGLKDGNAMFGSIRAAFGYKPD